MAFYFQGGWNGSVAGSFNKLAEYADIMKRQRGIVKFFVKLCENPKFWFGIPLFGVTLYIWRKKRF